ncbi:MAG: DinB family protein [Anaerolineae bacterium]
MNDAEQLRERLLSDLDDARQDLCTAIEGLDPEQEIYEGWTLKHLLAHLAGWDDAVLAALRAHLGAEEAGTPAAEGINAYNAQSVSTRQYLSYEQVRRECDLARDQVKEALRELPPAKLEAPLLFPWGPTGTVAQLIAVFVHHEHEHAAEIRQGAIS